MKNLFIKLLALFGLASSSAMAADSSTLQEGQCWTYKTRPGEEASFLVIRKIETHPKMGQIVHISIFGLKIKNPSAPNGYTDQAGHLPLSEASLRDSLKAKIHRSIPETGWKEGYEMWRKANGGVFTKPVSECVGFMEEAINRGNNK